MKNIEFKVYKVFENFERNHDIDCQEENSGVRLYSENVVLFFSSYLVNLYFCQTSRRPDIVEHASSPEVLNVGVASRSRATSKMALNLRNILRFLYKIWKFVFLTPFIEQFNLTIYSDC